MRSSSDLGAGVTGSPRSATSRARASPRCAGSMVSGFGDGAALMFDRQSDPHHRCGAGRELLSPQAWNSDEPRSAWPARTPGRHPSWHDGSTSTAVPWRRCSSRR